MAEGRVQALGPKDAVLAKMMQPRAGAGCRSRSWPRGRAHDPRVGERGSALDPPAPARWPSRRSISARRGRRAAGAATTELAGARHWLRHAWWSTATSRRCSNPTGGVCRRTQRPRGRQGERPGDVVVRLDETVTAGQPPDCFEEPPTSWRARQARLEAERDGPRTVFDFPAEPYRRACLRSRTSRG